MCEGLGKSYQLAQGHLEKWGGRAQSPQAAGVGELCLQETLFLKWKPKSIFLGHQSIRSKSILKGHKIESCPFTL